MKKKETPQIPAQEPVIEDLAVSEDLTGGVKGGYKVKLPDVLVSSYQSGGSDRPIE